MAKFRFDVGVIIYQEVTIEAEDLNSAKITLDEASKDLKDGIGFGSGTTKEGLIWDMRHKEIQWHGVKPNSVIEISEENPLE